MAHPSSKIAWLLLAWPALALAASPEEQSPYFLMGKTELVQWRPWGEAAFREAAEKGLPVLLDLGAMWCHYCVRMSATTYRDAETAERINEYFLPIKVDRDQHPEVDWRFQTELLELRGMGGWPLTGFLTEEGQMFAGTTYLPAGEDKAGRPGLKMVAERYGKDFQEQKRGYHNTAQEVANRFIQAGASADRGGKLEGLADHLAGQLVEQGFANGGFGKGPRFPDIPAFRFLLQRGVLRGEAQSRNLAERTLEAMADGGIRDLLGGGFHRATSDPAWRVPRFEKLLLVNAGMLELYADAARLLGSERYRRVADETAGFLLGTLADPGKPGLFTAQSADRDGVDNGSTYTWTSEEIARALDADARKMVTAYFDLKDEPRVIPDAPRANALAAATSIETASAAAGLKPEKGQKTLAAALATLRKLRASRPAPPVDRTLYSSLNGLGAHALLAAAPVLGNPALRPQALATLDLFLAKAWNDRTGFARGIRDGQAFGAGILQDQVYLAEALIDAHEATGERRYLDAARRALELCFKRFDSGDGRLMDLPVTGTTLFSALVIPDYPVQDSYGPGENAIAALAASRLGRLTGEEVWIERAGKIARAFAGSARGYGPGAATLALAAERILDPVPLVVVLGPSGAPEAQALADAALGSVRPRTLLRVASLEEIPRALRGKPLETALAEGPAPAVAVVSEGGVVRKAQGPAELQALLAAPAVPAVESAK